jgi:hypothetical protein
MRRNTLYCKWREICIKEQYWLEDTSSVFVDMECRISINRYAFSLLINNV